MGRHQWNKASLVEVEQEEAEDSSQHLTPRGVFTVVAHNDHLAEQREMDKDSFPGGDGPSLESAVAGRNTKHHRVDGHQDLGETQLQ